MREHDEEREQALALLRGDRVDPVRRELVQRIVGTRTREGRGAGIFGASRCQACGQLDTYEGFWSAVPLNTWSGVGFIDRRCLRKLSGVTGTGFSSEDFRRVGRAVRARHKGLCDLCGIEGENESARARLCPRCEEALLRQEGPLPQSWWRLKRVRYLELAGHDLEDLAAIAGLTEGQREELERRGY